MAKPKPVPTEDIQKLLDDTDNHTPPTPVSKTLGDQIVDLATLIKDTSDRLRIPVGAMTTIAQLAMNYQLTILQMGPPPGVTLQPPPAEEPADD